MISFNRYRAYSILAACATLALPQLVRGAEAQNLRVGVAKVDVTPKDIRGIISVTNKQFAGVREPIYARALVMDDGSTSAAIVAIDFVEFGDTMPLRQRIAKELGIPADHIMIAPSHDHSAPRGGPPTPNTSSMQGRPQSTPAYTQQADDTIVEALRKAKASMQPARVGVGTGEVDINSYRYAYANGRWRTAYNPDGPAYKVVWVLKFENLSGDPIAILMNYAVHSNVAAGARDNDNMIIGDLAGTAERYVESHYQDKVVALWTMGAAADQYAKFSKEGDPTWASTSSDEMIQVQGKMLGMEVLQVALRMTQMTSAARIQAAERIVPCAMNIAAGGGAGRGAAGGPGAGGPGAAQPQGQQWQQQPQQQTPQLQPGATLDLHMGLIRVNDVAITSVSGEVSLNIYARLRKESSLKDTMMITLANDRAGYIPDEANYDRMGAAFVRGCAEDAIIKSLTEMINATRQ